MNKKMKRALILMMFLLVPVFGLAQLSCPGCEDSDGENIFTKAAAVSNVILADSSCGSVISEDYCIDDDTLIEYVCDGTTVTAVAKACDYGCTDGACSAKIPEFNFFGGVLCTVAGLVFAILIKK